MTRWQAFCFISDALRSMLGRETLAIDMEQVSWDVVLRLASENFVTPTLAWALRNARPIPDAVRDYLDITLDLNRRRNETILDCLESALVALNSAGCEPLLLKGGAALLDEGLYPDVSVRYLGDLDILVPLSHLHDGAIALKKVGFQAVSELSVPVPKRWVRPRPIDLHHLPPLLHGETGVAIELHRTITLRRFDSILPATSSIEHQSKRRFRGLELFVLSPTDRIVHNIVHSQLHHGQHQRGTIGLRQLFELALLSIKFGSEIDWHDVENRFQGAGYLEVLQNHLQILQTHFSVPSVSAPHNPAILRRLQASVELTAAPASQGYTFARVVSDYVYYFLRNPLLAANLMNPFWWPERISAIRKRMRLDALD